MIEIKDLLGKPYKIYGRDKNGYDCYGLVIEVCKRMGHKMVDVVTAYDEFDGLHRINDQLQSIINCSGLIETDSTDYGNVILFFDRKDRVMHIGVKLYGDDFIHCDEAGVRITKLSSYPRKWKVYKWQS